MRRGFGIFGLVVTAIVLVLVSVVAYNIGWQNGVNTHLPSGTNAAPGYYYGYGDGFGPVGAIFGLFWFLLILFGIFWLFRLAFWGFAGRRMWMGGGWGNGRRGWGYGPGQSFEERAQEWHRRQHGDQTPPPSPPPPDTRSV